MAISSTIPSLLLLPPILLASIVHAQAKNIGTITQDVTTYAAFSQQRSCAQDCFVKKGQFCPQDILGMKIQCAQTSCTSSGWQARNDCYCSAGLMSPAQEFLAACVSTSCSVGDVSVDVSMATSIYARYCSEKGYTAGEPVANIATVTSGTKVLTTFQTGTGPAPTSGSSGGTDTSSTTSDSKSMPISTIIGIVVGAAGGLLLLAGAMWIFWKMFRQCRPANPPQQQNHHQLAQYDQKPVFPTFPNQQEYYPYPSPGPASEIEPNDSASMVGGPSMVGGMARPLPSLLSDTRYPGDMRYGGR